MLLCLVVDDDKAMAEISKEIAKSCGFKTDIAEDGVSAIKYCQENMPDVIILDWMMPNMDGVECLKKIRALNTDKQPYIIMCSAKDEPQNVMDAIQKGANTYITKPFTNHDLEAKLGLLIKIRRDI